jgi:hypothetical protein
MHEEGVVALYELRSVEVRRMVDVATGARVILTDRTPVQAVEQQFSSIPRGIRGFRFCSAVRFRDRFLVTDDWEYCDGIRR